MLPSDLAFALYRRVIEIDDGRLVLRPYAPTQAAVAALIGSVPTGRSPLASGPDDETAAEDALVEDALLEAASIAAALANLRSGYKAEADEGAPAADDPHDRGSVEAEAAWLVRVTAQFTRLPLVPRVSGRFDGLDGVDGVGAPTP